MYVVLPYFFLNNLINKNICISFMQSLGICSSILKKKKIPMHGNKGGCATGEGD
jgi:hypothetical protein